MESVTVTLAKLFAKLVNKILFRIRFFSESKCVLSHAFRASCAQWEKWAGLNVMCCLLLSLSLALSLKASSSLFRCSSKEEQQYCGDYLCQWNLESNHNSSNNHHPSTDIAPLGWLSSNHPVHRLSPTKPSKSSIYSVFLLSQSNRFRCLLRVELPDTSNQESNLSVHVKVSIALFCLILSTILHSTCHQS